MHGTTTKKNKKQLIWKILDYKFSIVILMYPLGLPVAAVEHISLPSCVNILAYRTVSQFNAATLLNENPNRLGRYAVTVGK
jgi:hypothetical protein